jgi:hypothetical protein
MFVFDADIRPGRPSRERNSLDANRLDGDDEQ